MEQTFLKSHRLSYHLFFPFAAVGLLAALGFYLRLAYLERMIFHVDEYMSLLAVSSIMQRGIPILPSSLFYDHGLLFSYVGALFAGSTGFSEAIVRWVSVVWGTLMIPVMYNLARRMFHSPTMAATAALVIALYPEAIKWGGRARMHGQAQFLYTGALLLLWIGLTRVSGQGYRYLFYLTFVAGLFSHFIFILTVPPLTLGTLFAIGYLRGRVSAPDILKRLWSPETLVAGGFLAMGLLAGNFIAFQVSQAAAVGVDGSQIIDIGFSFDRFSEIINFSKAPENMWLVILAGVGLVALIYKWLAGRLTREDDAGAFILVLLLGIFFETYLLLADQWRTERYYFLTLLPPLVLASSYGLKQISNLLVVLRQRGASGNPKSSLRLSEPLGGLAFAALVLVIFPRTTHTFAETFRTYRYDQAMQYVISQRVPEDTLMTVLPAAGALYAQPVDFYATEYQPFLIINETGNAWVDRYSGAPHVGSAAAFNDALSKPGRTWFVADDRRITRYDAYFRQQIQHQMNFDRRFDNVQILIEKENRWPLAEEPTHQADINLSRQATYSGYTLTPLESAFSLTLFWKLIAPVMDYKVFVHLRDISGRTVAQADFLPYDGVTGFHSWAKSEGTKDLFRTGIVLQIPPGLAPGDYDLYVGLYDPISGQRVPVTNDLTGENAIYLSKVQVP